MRAVRARRPPWVPQARAFYETEALRCGWSVQQLHRQIDSQFHERIALSHTGDAGTGIRLIDQRNCTECVTTKR